MIKLNEFSSAKYNNIQLLLNSLKISKFQHQNIYIYLTFWKKWLFLTNFPEIFEMPYDYYSSFYQVKIDWIE